MRRKDSWGLFGGGGGRKLLSCHNWRGLAGLLQYSANPIEVLFRYYFRLGGYPYKLQLRTPIGFIQLDMFSHQDLITVHEIFFRQDYYISSEIGSSLTLAVDFGANIGVASAYFLTRNPNVLVHSYEPVPENIARAKKNLEPFAARLIFHECAVGIEEGEVNFGVDESSRYGGIGLNHTSQIRVACRKADSELLQIAKRFGRIDILKIDVEGMEVPILLHLASEILCSIRCIFAECNEEDVSLPGFSRRQYLSVTRYLRSSGADSVTDVSDLPLHD